MSTLNAIILPWHVRYTYAGSLPRVSGCIVSMKNSPQMSLSSSSVSGGSGHILQRSDFFFHVFHVRHPAGHSSMFACGSCPQFSHLVLQTSLIGPSLLGRFGLLKTCGSSWRLGATSLAVSVLATIFGSTVVLKIFSLVRLQMGAFQTLSRA